MNIKKILYIVCALSSRFHIPANMKEYLLFGFTAEIVWIMKPRKPRKSHQTELCVRLEQILLLSNVSEQFISISGLINKLFKVCSVLSFTPKIIFLKMSNMPGWQKDGSMNESFTRWQWELLCRMVWRPWHWPKERVRVGGAQSFTVQLVWRLN